MGRDSGQEVVDHWSGMVEAAVASSRRAAERAPTALE